MSPLKATNHEPIEHIKVNGLTKSRAAVNGFPRMTTRRRRVDQARNQLGSSLNSVLRALDPINGCFFCGRSNPTTNDHIPPKGFFPKPRPSNLITVRACYECNHGFNRIDEQFRLAAASAINRSSNGSRIWNEKVVGAEHPFSRIRKDTGTITIYKETGFLTSPDDEIKLLAQVAVQPWMIEAFLTRVTRGLLRHFYPEFPIPEKQSFRYIFPNHLSTSAFVAAIPPTFLYDQRGDGVFDFWRRTESDFSQHGEWMFSFYRSSIFYLEHRSILA